MILSHKNDEQFKGEGDLTDLVSLYRESFLA